MKIIRSFWLWVGAVVVVFAVALVVAPQTSSQSARISHLESLVRCPSCDDLSVAQSNATSALAVRHEITQKVKAGKSDNAILTSLEDAYGTSILLSPSTSGLGVLLWVGPVLVVLVLVVIVSRIARRRNES